MTGNLLCNYDHALRQIQSVRREQISHLLAVQIWAYNISESQFFPL
jgi:hypothetical protein